MVKALIKLPGEPGEIRDVDVSEESLRQLFRGAYTRLDLTTDCKVLTASDVRGLAFNVNFYGWDIRGPLLIVGVNVHSRKKEYCDLPSIYAWEAWLERQKEAGNEG